MECKPLGPDQIVLVLTLLCSETSLDDVLQINNVFVNVSKGEVAKHGDLQKAFGKMELDDIVKEVGRNLASINKFSFSMII